MLVKKKLKEKCLLYQNTHCFFENWRHSDGVSTGQGVTKYVPKISGDYGSLSKSPKVPILAPKTTLIYKKNKKKLNDKLFFTDQ